MGASWMRYRTRALAVVAGAAAALLLSAAGPVPAGPVTGWRAYLGGPAHTSDNTTQTAISPATAPGLSQAWHFGGGFLASPTVADGAIFIGGENGWFYKLSEKTGAVLAKVYIGVQPKKTCSALGVVDTATVAASPVSHQDTVYVGGPDGFLYAFGAAHLTQEWKSVIAIPSTTVSDYFEWSSPTVANGKIYIGVSSNCDQPMIRGGVIAFDQGTGQKLAQFYSVPAGVTGGSVWSSVAVGPGGDVYASTGNSAPGATQRYDTESIVQLSPDTLARLGAFQVPAAEEEGDGDFGASPTVFGSYVGACNKNGIFYALHRSTMTLAWEARIGAKSSSTVRAECSAAADYNGHDLFFGGTATTIGGTAYRGSVQERNPVTGALVWATGLPNGVIGSPSMDAGGVLAVGTYDNSGTPNAVYLVNTATGAIIRTLYTGSDDFAQSTFANGGLYTANGTGAYGWTG
jgi:outer membrane protein assembly factor BamB